MQYGRPPAKYCACAAMTPICTSGHTITAPIIARIILVPRRIAIACMTGWDGKTITEKCLSRNLTTCGAAHVGLRVGRANPTYGAEFVAGPILILDSRFFDGHGKMV